MTNFGRQRGSKLFVSLRVARQLNEVLANQSSSFDPRHFVNLHVARGVTPSRQETGVVLEAGVLIVFVGIEPRTNGRHIMEFPDVNVAADGEFTATDGEAHRLHEIPEVGVQYALVVAQDHQLARLIGCYQNRQPRLGKYLRQVRGMDASQRGRGVSRQVFSGRVGHGGIVNHDTRKPPSLFSLATCGEHMSR